MESYKANSISISKRGLMSGEKIRSRLSWRVQAGASFNPSEALNCTQWAFSLLWACIGTFPKKLQWSPKDLLRPTFRNCFAFCLKGKVYTNWGAMKADIFYFMLSFIALIWKKLGEEKILCPISGEMERSGWLYWEPFCKLWTNLSDWCFHGRSTPLVKVTDVAIDALSGLLRLLTTAQPYPLGLNISKKLPWGKVHQSHL